MSVVNLVNNKMMARRQHENWRMEISSLIEVKLIVKDLRRILQNLKAKNLRIIQASKKIMPRFFLNWIKGRRNKLNSKLSFLKNSKLIKMLFRSLRKLVYPVRFENYQKNYWRQIIYFLTKYLFLTKKKTKNSGK